MKTEAVTGAATPPLWYVAALVAILTIVGSTAIAVGAYCPALILQCIVALPFLAVSGTVFFGIPVSISSALLVVLLTGGGQWRAHKLALAAVAVSEAIVGFVLGATFLIGQGP